MELLPHVLTILSIPMFATVLSRWLDRQLIKDKKQTVSKAIVHEDILINSAEAKRNMPMQERVLENLVREDIEHAPNKNLEERLLEHYHESDITPELIKHFDDNYLNTLLKHYNKNNLSSEIENLEKRQLARLEAVKKVKGLYN